MIDTNYCYNNISFFTVHMHTLLRMGTAVVVSLNSMFATHFGRNLPLQRSCILTFIIIIIPCEATINNVIIRAHNITVNPVEDRTDGGQIKCREDDLTHPYCCVTCIQEPSEQLMVDSNFHYTMRTYIGISSLLVHISEQTPGYVLSSAPGAVVGSSVTCSSSASIQKPMF